MENFKAWFTYTKERFGCLNHFFLVGGLSLSGMSIASDAFSPVGVSISFTLLLAFFYQLRLMDEYKDYDKDVLANPGRPLPRGLLDKERVATVIKGLQIILLILPVLLLILVPDLTNAALMYLVTMGYLWLMYEEFFMKDWLSTQTLIDVALHQVIVVLFCVFPALTVNGDNLFNPLAWYYGITVVGGFLCFEISRKLDPNKHKVLKTYLSLYGPKKTYALVIAVTLIAALGAYLTGYHFLWAFEIVMVAVASLIVLKPEKFKLVEMVAMLSVAAHVWSGVIGRFL
ncbi:UbiA family prenyltransferase [Deltaproteobacteria bacterium TL4]